MTPQPKPFPRVVLKHPVAPATQSWWIGLPREAFQARAWAETPRMNLGAGASYIGWMVVGDATRPKPNRGFGLVRLGD